MENLKEDEIREGRGERRRRMTKMYAGKDANEERVEPDMKSVVVISN
jgi:hypothetical protein